ncbi:ABC transporter permease [Haloimpatiens lingqiaonensis]|uniref:ABC transporter permease n=1 Tax=Haloimpatiens lingqiaonensis TaxID=1380675 RepID=UPI001FAB123F|nr:ABC transporter permease [Haloimpatiens lingqiaonensis]
MNIVSIVYKKELKDMFRDKKTLIAAILIPLLMYPIIFGFMGKGMKSNMDSVKKEMNVVIVDKGNSKLGQLIKSQKNIKLKESKDVFNDVKEGKILLGLEIPEDFDKNINEEKKADIIITMDNTSQKSNMAMSEINAIIDQYSKAIVGARLQAKNIDTSILTPVNPVIKSAEKKENGMAKMMLSLLLPMMLIMFAASGPIASATDLGAGEKERGTLEPLLTTQASRMSLLWGKFLAITTMGIVTSIAFISGLGISMKTSPEAFNYGVDGAKFSMEPKTLLIIALITVLLTMVFGALALSISIYARSFKEAQTYLTPLSFIGMLGFTSYFIEPKNMSMIFLNIPVVNATAVIKELILGMFNIQHLIIVLAWMLVYIVLSLSFARYMFSKEEVIFRT